MKLNCVNMNFRAGVLSQLCAGRSIGTYARPPRPLKIQNDRHSGRIGSFYTIVQRYLQGGKMCLTPGSLAERGKRPRAADFKWAS